MVGLSCCFSVITNRVSLVEAGKDDGNFNVVDYDNDYSDILVCGRFGVDGGGCGGTLFVTATEDQIGDVDYVSVSYLISLLIHMAYTDKMQYWEYQGIWYQNALLRN